MNITSDMLAEYESAGRGARQTLAATWGLPYNTLRAAVSKTRAQLVIPENIVPSIEAPLQTEQPAAWAYISDLHCPQHDRHMLRRLVNAIEKTKTTHLIIGGDLFDFARISKFPKVQDTPSTKDTLDTSGAVLVYLSHFVSELIVLPGNHDLRLAGKVDDVLTYAQVIHAAIAGREMKSKLTITSNDYIYLGPSGDTWLTAGWVVGHPRFYAQHAKGLSEVADLQQRNVIGAHTHVQAVTWSKSGRYRAIDPGCMTDAHQHGYHAQSAGLSKFAAWKQGFVIVKDNIPTIYADGLVKW